MGQHVANVEVVHDHTDGRNFVRLHMDVDIPGDIVGPVQEMLKSGQFDKAKKRILQANPTLNNVAMLEAAFSELKAVRTSSAIAAE
jgi:hypothetical protein